MSADINTDQFFTVRNRLNGKEFLAIDLSLYSLEDPPRYFVPGWERPNVDKTDTCTFCTSKFGDHLVLTEIGSSDVLCLDSTVVLVMSATGLYGVLLETFNKGQTRRYKEDYEVVSAPVASISDVDFFEEV